MTYTPKTNGELLARGAAKAMGLELTPTGELNVIALLDTFLTYPEEGAPLDGIKVVVNGETTSPQDFVARWAATHPDYFRKIDAAPAASTTSAPNLDGLTMTERALALTAHARRSAVAIREREAAEIVQRQGNPWRAGKTFNRTVQALVTNTAPDLAARLKAEAGA